MTKFFECHEKAKINEGKNKKIRVEGECNGPIMDICSEKKNDLTKLADR